MNAAIFTIGNEILSGKTLNSNSCYISRQLNSYGFKVVKHITVEDNSEKIIKVMHALMQEVDLIVTTGGLGPTYDDITLESIAKSCKLELIFFPAILEDIKEKFSKYGSKMGENNISQAYFPIGTQILPNPYGTAPGMFLKHNNKVIISLPGPPRENIPMFDNHVVKELEKLKNGIVNIKDIIIFGIGESNVETLINEKVLIEEGMRIATYVIPRYVIVRLTSKSIESINIHKERIYKLFGNKIIGEDNNKLEDIVVSLMSKKGMTLSLAESCTGGMLASHIVNIPGSSNVLERSIITYSNKAKIDELSVSEDSLYEFGAVSETIASEMVEGLFNKTHSDICVAITGIAGPSGASKSKPVGLTYIAIKSCNGVYIKKYIFFGDRFTNRHKATLNALNLIRMELIE